MKNIFWTGGFDSTALLLHRVREGFDVVPYYFKMGNTWQKQIHEAEAKAEILKRIPLSWRKKIANPVILEWVDLKTWRHNWYGYTSEQNILMSSIMDALQVNVEMALVKEDQTAQTPWVLDVFKQEGVELPTIHTSKHDMLNWELNEYLQYTWSCERHDYSRNPCGECFPCQARIISSKLEDSYAYE